MSGVLHPFKGLVRGLMAAWLRFSHCCTTLYYFVGIWFDFWDAIIE